MSNSKIPHIIHYVWFGGGKKDIVSQKCLKSWKKYLPDDYQIIEWNESNVNISEMPLYVRQAYEAKKYAFASDYVRLLKVNEYGGIYLDTDMEICKPFDSLLENYNMVLCYFNKMPMTSFFASVSDNIILQSLIKQYHERQFIKDDGTFDLTPIDFYFYDSVAMEGFNKSSELQEFGNNCVVYPNRFFCSFNCADHGVYYCNDTYMVHHINGSWGNKNVGGGVLKAS